MFIITQNWNPKNTAIWCTDEEWHGEDYVGIGANTAKIWKTKAGADRYAAERWNHPQNVNRKTGRNEHTVQIEEA